MQAVAASIPFLLAIGCLVLGVKKRSSVIYSTAFGCLVFALIAAVTLGETLPFSGGFFMLFSAVAFVLSDKLETVSAMSKSGLRMLAGVIFALGFLFTFLIG